MPFRWTENDYSALYEDIVAMDEQQRLALDKIGNAIDEYRDKFVCDGCQVLNNRVSSLAAVRVVDDYERLMFERE